jgi:hypothetical protein
VHSELKSISVQSIPEALAKILRGFVRLASPFLGIAFLAPCTSPITQPVMLGGRARRSLGRCLHTRFFIPFREFFRFRTRCRWW